MCTSDLSYDIDPIADSRWSLSFLILAFCFKAMLSLHILYCYVQYCAHACFQMYSRSTHGFASCLWIIVLKASLTVLLIYYLSTIRLKNMMLIALLTIFQSGLYFLKYFIKLQVYPILNYIVNQIHVFSIVIYKTYPP